MSGAEVVPHGVAGHRAHSFVRTPEFQAFTSVPALRDVAAVILACEPRLLPRQILREYSPGSNRASRAHTDHVYMSRGTENVVTAWIPIGDCSLASGSLVYLEGSHHLQPDELDAVRAVTDRSDPRRLSHDLGWVARRLGRRWLVGDYRAGDVVFHSPHMIHATLDVSGTMPRLSTDVRFIPATEEADERWLKTWSGDDGN
jgi:ectoine hydroxylase-related dioxygenase (phytanoyl-CoA dioxygenase family)